MTPLTILHVMRAPVGGLFRHVADLSRAQAERGHRVGLIADSTTGAAGAEETLAALAPLLSLGIRRVAMSRHLGPSDIAATRAVARFATEAGAQIVHGHGAKGGAYARLGAPRTAIRCYTPHGGSLHYSPTSPLGLLYLNLERILKARTDLFLFESDFGRRAFEKAVGTPGRLVRVVHNGVSDAEFAAIEPAPDASDLVFIGELRTLKGVDVLIDAIALLSEKRALSATIVGEGPDSSAFRDRVSRRGLSDRVRFPGALPARIGFAHGRILVAPSRAESLPYIVLEAAAASVPLITTAVGGIPEIFGDDSGRLVPPGDAPALAAAILHTLEHMDEARDAGLRLQSRVRSHFSVERMTDQVLGAYAAALERSPRL